MAASGAGLPLGPGDTGDGVRDLQTRLAAAGFPVSDEAGTFGVGTAEALRRFRIARRFDVMSIPTLIVFQDGQPAKRMVGAKGKGQLLQELSEFLD